MEKFLYKKNIDKNPDVKIWFAFPGIYSFAMSSIGYLWLYKKLDELEGVGVERIYSDTDKTEFNVKDIDLFGFSFSFDLDFLTIFKMLEKHSIPLKSSERDDSHPLVFGGGPVLGANPAPYSEFFDFMIIGDGENVNENIVEIYKQYQNQPKNILLEKISELEGVYVPKISHKVKKLTSQLNECIYTPILSDKSFFKNTFIMEITRGCANRCSFCLASYLNLPSRFVDYDKIIKTIDIGLENTNKIALLGALITAHPKFGEICDYIYEKIQNNNEIEMSVTSLRADSIEPKIVKTLVAAGQKNSTIAIEAASERLRKVVNKNLSEEQIFNTVKTARENGLHGLKLYSMIGLPTETQEDLNDFITLAKNLKNENKGFDLTFSFSGFVPKPHTPLQWSGRENIKQLEKKQNYLKKEFHKLGIKARFSSAKWDYYQTLLSRGDNSFSDYLVDVYKNGGNLGAFKSAANGKINTDDYVLREYKINEALPWDFIEITPGKEFLIKEYERCLSF